MVGKKGKTVYSHDFWDGYKGTFDNKDEQQHYLKKLLPFSEKKNAKYKKENDLCL